ncbi:Ig-like domain-containing protein [Anaeromyxobacter paludicola]|uniref:BIG2 domain-containing protein n=1 Tax=Anaeromyxobacter paludicola TaxID=2918171 RepID=A0ABN6NB80_9BACT|nr:Ig-like domain-containing protein [Anaeromyxobacter paludicola]BDG09625.1 hypothetical protein AMPC_27380 [Anaeromyxobacter paludicola]
MNANDRRLADAPASRRAPSPLRRGGQGRGGQPSQWLRACALALLAAVAATGCKSSSSAPPALSGLAVTPGAAFAVVGDQTQLAVTARYANGTTAAFSGTLQWSSSDPAVAAVTPAGVVTAAGAGTATLTARDPASGLSGAAQFTARAATNVATAPAPPATGQVGATQAYVRYTGLTPGGFYVVTLGGLTDDLDLAVYADASLAQDALLCSSSTVGTAPESCLAQATAKGELFVSVDGTWSEAGSSYQLALATPTPAALAGTLALGQPALSGSVDAHTAVYKVTGLTPGAQYQLKLSGLTADLDLAVYSDPYLYGEACASYLSGNVDDACTTTASAAGELYAEVDGESSGTGGHFQLSVAAR